jgi:hypothetical protein
MRLFSVNHHMLWRHLRPPQPDVSTPVRSTRLFSIFGFVSVDRRSEICATHNAPIHLVNIHNPPAKVLRAARLKNPKATTGLARFAHVMHEVIHTTAGDKSTAFGPENYFGRRLGNS